MSPAPTQKHLAKAVCAEIALDSVDFWNRWLQYLVLPLLSVYAAIALFRNRDEQPTQVSENEFEFVARDSGQRMIVQTPFPDFLLQAHTFTALALFMLTFTQKLLLPRMAETRLRVQLHRYAGYVILALSSAMAAAGFAMRSYPSIPGFATFSYFFAAPWLFLSITVLASARSKDIALHRLLGNMLLKACIAVPLSRIMGAVLQRWWDCDDVRAQCHAQAVAEGYFHGIADTSLVVACWQVADVLSYVQSKWGGDVSVKKTK